jgi:DNA-binding PadR family transcriptional regulator
LRATYGLLTGRAGAALQLVPRVCGVTEEGGFISGFDILESRYYSSENMVKAVADRMVKSFLDLFVLSLLNGGSCHGYEIMRELKTQTGTRIGAGTLYPLLYELEQRQFVLGEWTSPTKRSRRVYKITEKGEKYMTQGFKGINHLVSSVNSNSPGSP